MAPLLFINAFANHPRTIHIPRVTIQNQRSVEGTVSLTTAGACDHAATKARALLIAATKRSLL